MTRIIITDTHFGVKNNSQLWLGSQLDFIYKQLIPTIDEERKHDTVRLIHMGDVFDSRSTISTMVATKVIEAFKALCKHATEFVVVGGNHDYYSPTSDEINSIDLFLEDTGIQLVTKDYLCKSPSGDCFVPWYEWINKKDQIQESIDNGIIRNIYTHADIIGEDIGLTGYDSLWSGHIHVPSMDYKNHNFNPGSCYALNFTDANDKRGFYIIRERQQPVFVENTQSIKFYRLYDDDILSNDYDIKPNDYIEAYIDQYNLVKDSFNESILHYSDSFKNFTVIPVTSTHINESSEEVFKLTNIEEICKQCIPDNLKEKFEQVLKSIENSK